MRRVSLEHLLEQNMRDKPYREQYEQVLHLISEEKIKPVNASGTNGMKPALHLEYWILDSERTKYKGKNGRKS